MSDVLQICEKKQDSVTIVYLAGRLDTNASRDADAVLKRLVASGCLQIILNLSDLNYISSSGLRIIISTLRTLKQKNGDLKLACLNQPVKEIFHLTGFDRLFLFYDSEDTAVVSFSILPFDKNEQRVLNAIATTLEIEEERRRTEEDLRASENLYRTIFRNAGTAMAIIEDDLTIFLANNEFEKMVGYTNDELAEVMNLLSFVVRDDLAKVTEFHDQVRKNSESQPKRYELRFKDRVGNVRYVYVTVDMVPDMPRRVYSFLDITELRTIEEDLRNELTSKREFIILAAHELRTPLQPAVGYLDLILDDPDFYGLNEDAKILVRKCSENIDHARQIIEHIIKLSGYDYDPNQELPRFKPQLRELCPYQVLISYLNVLRSTNPIAVSIQVPDDLKLTTDSEYFYLIGQSLISTLIRYSAPPGTIEITYHDDAINHYFMISTRNAVIAQEILPNLFKPRFVGDESKLREKSGFIGLGLPVAKQMAEKLNGDITVASATDTGTIFTLVLPKSATRD